MGDFAHRDEIDALAADLFSNDHPHRSWTPFDGVQRIGVASAIEKAVYRGFAAGRLAAESRGIPEPAIAAAALAAGTATIKPRV